MLDLLELNLGSCANLDDCNATSKLCKTLLELLAVEVRSGVLNLSLDLSDALVDCVLGTSATNDGCSLLGNLDGLSATEHLCADLVKVNAELLDDCLAAGENSDILEHALTTVAVCRSLDCADVQNAAELVEDKGGQSLAVDVLSHDEQRCALLLDCLKDRQDILDGGNLVVGHEDVRIVQLSGESLVVGCEVRGNITLVKLHTLNSVDVDAEGLGLLNGDDAVLADNVHSVGNLATDDWITCGNGTNGSNLLLS